jgi:hydrogenase expression/formation protein HypD
MKYLEEFRNPKLARRILAEIKATVTRPWVIMEICGGQTHSIIRNGIDQLLPVELELVHGPGCPVCVTPLEKIDKAIEIASRPGIIFTSFGDMLRVPGSEKDLLVVKSEGGDVRTVYSPLEAIRIAHENPDKEVVFFAVGFETTAPANAMAIRQAAREKLPNFSELVSHVMVPPAMKALLSSRSNRVQGYLAAGHVCTVMGLKEYEPIAEQYEVPIVATGFEPLDLLEGILLVVRQLEQGRHEVENQYLRSVKREGNRPAREIVNEVYEIVDRNWRGIGEIPSSGLRLRDKYARFDAEKKFSLGKIQTRESELCISALGATMVSSEGACAAYYKYHHLAET